MSSFIFEPTDEDWMNKALDDAERAYDAGEVPIGCVIVKDNKIIGRGWNRMEGLQDPTAHSEMIAIGAACSHLENWRLEDCTLYVTLEPCPMCAGAILNSRIKRVVYGAPDHRLGACGTRLQVLENNPINRPIEISGGILKERCLGLIQGFFIELREKKKMAKLDGEIKKNNLNLPF